LDEPTADHGQAADRREGPRRGPPSDPALAGQGRQLAASAEHEPGGARFHRTSKGGGGPGLIRGESDRRAWRALAKLREGHRMVLSSESRSSIGRPPAFHMWGIYNMHSSSFTR